MPHIRMTARHQIGHELIKYRHDRGDVPLEQRPQAFRQFTTRRHHCTLEVREVVCETLSGWVTTGPSVSAPG